MTILSGGSELPSFKSFNAHEEAIAGRYDPEYARGAIHVKKGGYIRTETLANQNEIYIHFQVFAEIKSPILIPIVVQNSIGATLFSIAANGEVKIAGGAYGTVPIIQGELVTWDIYIRGGAQGVVEIYADNQLVYSRTGTFAISGMQNLILQPFGEASTGNHTGTYYSQVITATESLIGAKLETLVFDGAGSSNQWIGTSSNTHLDVNEFGIDYDTYITTPSAGNAQSWTLADVTSDERIRAIIIAFLAKNAIVGPKNVEASINGHYFATAPLATGYTPVIAVSHVDPDTQAAWTKAKINTSQVGIRSKV